MASAQVMTMMVDGGAGKERQAVEETAAAQDVYVKLKTLKKHMEFLDIQVRCCLVVRGVGLGGMPVGEVGLGGRVWVVVDRRDLSISVFSSLKTR